MSIHSSLTQHTFSGTGQTYWTFRDFSGAYVAFQTANPDVFAVGEDADEAGDNLGALLDHMSDGRAAEDAEPDYSRRDYDRLHTIELRRSGF